MSLYRKDSEEEAGWMSSYPLVFKKNLLSLLLVFFRYPNYLHKHA